MWPSLTNSYPFHFDIQSIEIQKRVGAFGMALDTINKCLSEAICSLSRGKLDGETQTAALIHSGNEILEMCKYYPEIRYFFLICTYRCFPKFSFICILILMKLHLVDAPDKKNYAK